MGPVWDRAAGVLVMVGLWRTGLDGDPTSIPMDPGADISSGERLAEGVPAAV